MLLGGDQMSSNMACKPSSSLTTTLCPILRGFACANNALFPPLPNYSLHVCMKLDSIYVWCLNHNFLVNVAMQLDFYCVYMETRMYTQSRETVQKLNV